MGAAGHCELLPSTEAAFGMLQAKVSVQDVFRDAPSE